MAEGNEEVADDLEQLFTEAANSNVSFSVSASATGSGLSITSRFSGEERNIVRIMEDSKIPTPDITDSGRAGRNQVMERIQAMETSIARMIYRGMSEDSHNYRTLVDSNGVLSAFFNTLISQNSSLNHNTTAKRAFRRSYIALFAAMQRTSHHLICTQAMQNYLHQKNAPRNDQAEIKIISNLLQQLLQQDNAAIVNLQEEILKFGA